MPISGSFCGGEIIDFPHIFLGEAGERRFGLSLAAVVVCLAAHVFKYDGSVSL